MRKVIIYLKERDHPHCNFCGKHADDEEVFRMIAGVDAMICDKCIEDAVDILKEEL